MVYLLIGALGLIFIHLGDPIALKRLPLLKPLVTISGVGMACFASIMVSLSPDKVELPAWTTWAGWTVLTVSCLLVIYSLFINLPFYKTYIAKGVGDTLITTGFYALTRHPGVLWTVLFFIGLSLVSRSHLVIISAPFFIVLDVILVAIQDRFFFCRMFRGYKQYQKDTPMLIPNKKSIQVFFHSIGFERNHHFILGGHDDFKIS